MNKVAIAPGVSLLVVPANSPKCVGATLERLMGLAYPARPMTLVRCEAHLAVDG
jgi:hypothetical protein